MPRPVRVKSRIRDLRAIIGKTQREFALSIGISPIALNRIENNTLALSRRVARKIVVETGVAPRSLLATKGKLRTESGEQYTAQSYRNWKEDEKFEETEHLAIEAAQWLGSWIEVLLRAATYGSKKRMRAVLNEIAETVDRCRVDFNLERPIDDVIAKQRSPSHAKDEALLRMKTRRAWLAPAPVLFGAWRVIRPPQNWEVGAFTAPRKPRPSSRPRPKA